MIKKIEKRCYNEKPLILHSLRVGLRLMDLKQEKDVVIAGFLHDLLEDTDCRPEEIEEKFGRRAAKLVLACTFDKDIKDYKERWKKLISNIKRAGREAMIIKLADQMDNLPYYTLITDREKRQEVMWKHRSFIKECGNDLRELQIFRNYKKMVSAYRNNQ